MFVQSIRRGIALLACLAAISAAPQISAADDVYQSVNANKTPGNFFWAADTIGWYWTPAADVELVGIQTKLATATNINNNHTFTTKLYSDRPAAGGMELGTFDWNGVAFVDGPWLGGSFASPLSLTGGQTYFIGMSGWAAALFPGGGAGVNWLDPSDLAMGENLGAGSSYGGADYSIQFSPSGLGTTDAPILRFIEVPEPASLVLLSGAALMALRRRRGAVTR